ncbi:MAG: hypothetical protein ACJ76D_00820 [Solirubrobacterales bacterium]
MEIVTLGSSQQPPVDQLIHRGLDVIRLISSRLGFFEAELDSPPTEVSAYYQREWARLAQGDRGRAAAAVHERN